MSIGLFILAGKLPDAMVVALERMKDVNLAIAICRLTEGNDGPELTKIMEKHFIAEGDSCDDPWLPHIGHWWLKREI